MNVAFCYESVLPHRGGCETYIARLAQRMAADGHEVHLYACRWDASALPPELHYHRVWMPRLPRFLRPWYFGAACRRLLRRAEHEATVGFDKIAGLDVVYPQAGVYAASVDFNLFKHPNLLTRRRAARAEVAGPGALFLPGAGARPSLAMRGPWWWRSATWCAGTWSTGTASNPTASACFPLRPRRTGSTSTIARAGAYEARQRWGSAIRPRDRSLRGNELSPEGPGAVAACALAA